VDQDTSSTLRRTAFPGYQTVWRMLMVGMLAGLALPVGYATQAPDARALVSIATVGLVASGAAAAVGGLIGFVFGIPRQLQDERPPAAPSETSAESAIRPSTYAGNTSLEQISDWLTKILVGVGLTQLANLPAAFDSLGRFLSPALGGSASASVFAPLLVVYFLLGGFFLSYLWTRLYLPSLFAESDVRVLIATAEDRGEQKAIRAVAETASAIEADAGTSAAVRLHALWVDDRPESHQSETDLLTRRGVQFDMARSTGEALDKVAQNPGRYDFVISDLSRPEDRNAGYTLLDRLRKSGQTMPYILYTSARRADHETARRLGALESTSSPSRLLELVRDIAESARQGT
jgi:CheY-like chemotaxis protein